MKWVTRSHVHVDRIACPWLITRFVDSDAEFLFVSKSQVQRVAEETGAIPFDAPGVELGHRDGKCSFETIVEHFDLSDKALLRLAEIVHAADVRTDRAESNDLVTDPPQPDGANRYAGELVPSVYPVGQDGRQLRSAVLR